MARLTQAVIDAWNPHALARFWEEALDDFHMLPFDADEYDDSRAAGHTPETAPAAILDGPGFRIWFQAPERSMEHPGHLHFDVTAEDRKAEVARLVTLGATVQGVFNDWTTLQDPEGNVFCVL